MKQSFYNIAGGGNVRQNRAKSREKRGRTISMLDWIMEHAYVTEFDCAALPATIISSKFVEMCHCEP